MRECMIDARITEYPHILDADGAVRHEQVLSPFLKWYMDLPGMVEEESGDKVQYNHIKFAKKWLMASAQIGRSKMKLEPLAKGEMNRYTEYRVIEQMGRDAQNQHKKASGKSVQQRCSHLPKFDEQLSMMDLCFQSHDGISKEPLRVMQTALEYRLSFQTGVRMQVVNSLIFEQMWLSPKEEWGVNGMHSFTIRNQKRLKTNAAGAGLYHGFLPHSNPLFDSAMILGLTLLYRFSNGEPFPDVFAECTNSKGVKCLGYQYKWLPVIVSDQRKRENIDEQLLSYRTDSEPTQNKCFNMMFAQSFIQRANFNQDTMETLPTAGDSVTYQGRYACQQEFLNEVGSLGGADLIVEKALNYIHETTSEAHYHPEKPAEFVLQRAGLNWKHFEEADSVQLRLIRENKELIDELINLALPALKEQELKWKQKWDELRVRTNCTFEDWMKMKSDNESYHIRDAKHFLDLIRELLRFAIAGVCCRPKDKKHQFDPKDESIIKKYGKTSEFFRRIRMKDDDMDINLFDHELFEQLHQIAMDTENKREEEFSMERLRTAEAVRKVLEPDINELKSIMKKVEGQNDKLHDAAVYKGDISPPIVQNGDFGEYDFKLGTQIVTEKHGIRITYEDTNTAGKPEELNATDLGAYTDIDTFWNDFKRSEKMVRKNPKLFQVGEQKGRSSCNKKWLKKRKIGAFIAKQIKKTGGIHKGLIAAREMLKGDSAAKWVKEIEKSGQHDSTDLDEMEFK